MHNFQVKIQRTFAKLGDFSADLRAGTHAGSPQKLIFNFFILKWEIFDYIDMLPIGFPCLFVY